MAVLNWLWRIILLVTSACFVTTVYYMTHDIDMGVILPIMNIITVAGAALLGVLWVMTRRYWYVLVMLVVMGLMRGLFDGLLITEFQSVWILISGGFVAFVALVTLIIQVFTTDKKKRQAVGTLTTLQQALAQPAPGQPVFAQPVYVQAPPVQAAQPVQAPPPAQPGSTLVPPPAEPAAPAVTEMTFVAAPAAEAEPAVKAESAAEPAAESASDAAATKVRRRKKPAKQ